MTTDDLSLNYLKQASIRVEILPEYLKRGGYNIVIREAQEAVELAMKGIVRKLGIEPPKWHDVGPILQERLDDLPQIDDINWMSLIAISQRLRKERELSFYGDIDFLPMDNYTETQALEAIADAQQVLDVADRVIRSR